MESILSNSSPSGMFVKVPPRYLELVRSCRVMVVNRYSEFFRDMFDEIDNFMLQLADHAETNAMRSHYFEAMHEILLRQADIQEIFAGELERGFENFVTGITEPLRKPISQEQTRLQLIEKEDYEVSLAYAEVARKANESFAEQLFALSHRLAVISGGIKLGANHPALPGSPTQVCDAMQNALKVVEMPFESSLNIAWVQEFERKIVQRGEEIYANFNSILSSAGILPNLSLEASGYKDPQAQAVPAALVNPATESQPEPVNDSFNGNAEPSEMDHAAAEQELFQSIQQLLAARHMAPSVTGPSLRHAPQTDLRSLINSLNSLQVSTPPIEQTQFAAMSLETIQQSFAEQTAKLTALLQQQQVTSADADIIDLVGMLFEYILKDNSLPDSVKALLSQLHTPLLKVALIDRKFFFRNMHPARRLLNVFTQAGALCNGADGNNQGVFAMMRTAVERIVRDFENDTSIFSKVLEDFELFMESLERRSELIEKRSIETAKGRERLREARQMVSKEIVDRTWNQMLPKAAENFLMGPWANLLVLTNLRNGTESDEWHNSLKAVDDVIWCVQPRSSKAEQQRLRELLPILESKLQAGLELIGDPDLNTKTLLDDLFSVCRECLKKEVADPPGDQPARGEVRPKVQEAPPEVHSEKAIWDDIDMPVAAEARYVMNATPESLAVLEKMRSVKVGTWFEFIDPVKKSKQRAKLSWFSPKTMYYIFVNQSGIQVAVKSLRTLCREMSQGETRIVSMEKKPLVDRALETVYSLLKQSKAP